MMFFRLSIVILQVMKWIPRDVSMDECTTADVSPIDDSFSWTLNLIELPKVPAQFCGAALVKLDGKNESDIFITAATCRMDGNLNVYGIQLTQIRTASFSAVAGANVVTDTFVEAVKVDVDEFIIHPNYTLCEETSSCGSKCIKTRPPLDFDEFTPANNDLAISKLKSPIEFSQTILPVFLPRQGKMVRNGIEGMIAGWGAYILRNEETPLLSLHSEKLTTTDLAECEQLYQLIDQGTFLCAIGPPTGATSGRLGDLGGPFVQKRETGHLLLGVTTNVGYNCFERSAGSGMYKCAGVYTHASAYVDWIESVIEQLSGSRVEYAT